jgi:hypothetical protein
MLSFKEVQKIVCKRYNLDAATAAETASSLIFGDDLDSREIKKCLRTEKDVNLYLDYLELMGESSVPFKHFEKWVEDRTNL